MTVRGENGIDEAGVERRGSGSRPGVDALARLLGVPSHAVRRWVRVGLLRPAPDTHEAPDTVSIAGSVVGGPAPTPARPATFDFRQITAARTLAALGHRGVSPERVRADLDRAAEWFPAARDRLAGDVVERDGDLLLRLEAGELADPAGQLVIEFDRRSADSRPVRRSAEGWIEEGRRREDAGELPAAAVAYRAALAEDDRSAVAHLRLGNIRALLEEPGAAGAEYLRAVEIDPTLAEAWNRLGAVLAELGEAEAAARALDRALACAPVARSEELEPVRESAVGPERTFPRERRSSDESIPTVERRED